MSGRALEINGRKVWILETGTGAPLLYLHGFADVHSVKESWMPFHEKLAQHASVIAPAHPGCAQTDENKDIDIIEDVVFHYLEVFDALKLTQFDLVGSCVGGWIAAEIAARHPEKVRKLVLIGATGLFVEGALIGDVFMMAQPEYGSSYASLREMLFSGADQPNCPGNVSRRQRRAGGRGAQISDVEIRLAHRFQTALLLQSTAEESTAQDFVSGSCCLG